MRPFILLVCFFCFLIVSTNTQAQTANTKPQITIDHLALFVVDLQKEQNFYSQVMQLDSLAEPFHDGKHAWFTIGDGIAMHIIQGAPQTKEYYKNNHMCFSVPVMEAFTKHLTAHSVPYEDVKGTIGAITNRIDGIHQIWIKDPEGYWIEINDAPHKKR
jgi:lactoylglutathione lyase